LTTMSSQALLYGLRMIDFSNEVSGAQVSQFLADQGADVIHVEPPRGSKLRARASWPSLGRGKKSIQLDLKDPNDLAVARALVSEADVLLETFRPGVADRLGLGFADLSHGNPGLVHASISGFGSQGPYAGLQGYEGIVMAKMGAYWVLEGMAARPGPSFCSAPYCSYPASQLAVQGILAALYNRGETGLGQKVETSLAQGLSIHDTYSWFTRVIARKFSDAFQQRARIENGVPTGGNSFRLLVALTKDGKWLQFSQTTRRLFVAMMNSFGLTWMFEDSKWSSLPDFDSEDQRREFWEILLNIVRSKTHAEWLSEFERNPNVWGEQFRQHSDVLRHPQMIHNRMVSERIDPNVGLVREPAALVRVDGAPAKLDKPAPGLGQYDSDVRANAGLHVSASSAKTLPTSKPPLEGVTIVELGSYYAAPFGATLLADMGARIIKLEPLDGDPQRGMLAFPEAAGMKALLGKESVAVNLATPQGLEIAHRILARTDIVLQGFRAGVAERLGLDSATLQGRFPELVYLSATGYGEDGPHGHRPAFAPTIGAGAGLAFRNVGDAVPSSSNLTLEEIMPASLQLSTAGGGVGNADGISAVSAGSALILGLLARQRGAGAHKLFTSMLSSTAHCLSDVMTEYADRPEIATAGALCYGFSALYRLYPAAGDEWVFLAAPTEREWLRLAAALPEGDVLAADPRFATTVARKVNDADLAAVLEGIFRTRRAPDWEQHMRAFDVACVMAARGPVEGHLQDSGSIGEVQGFVTECYHPILEETPRLKALIRFSRSETVARGASLVGQETEGVLKEFGYSAEEIANLAADGVIGLG